jgi:hypothetical protein
MEEIYRITIHGRKLESRDLRQLLARAVQEKRNLDQRLRIASSAGRSADRGWSCTSPSTAAFALGAVR